MESLTSLLQGELAAAGLPKDLEGHEVLEQLKRVYPQAVIDTEQAEKRRTSTGRKGKKKRGNKNTSVR